MFELLALILFQIPGVDKGPWPRISQAFPSEKVPDVGIERALQKYGTLSWGEWYYYNRVDLNGDGQAEAIVYLVGRSACGSGGCPLFVLMHTGNTWNVVTEISNCNTPIVVSSQRTNGWKDLILWQRSYAWNREHKIGQPSYYARLPFDGQRYPENPMLEPAMPLDKVVKGVALMVNQQGPEFGVQIKVDR